MGALLATTQLDPPFIEGQQYNALLAGRRVWVDVNRLAFVINSGADAAFIIPTSSATDASYHWKINWGDGSAEQTASGTSSDLGGRGIEHNFPAANTAYTISIRPVTPAIGWLRAFGFHISTVGSGVQANRSKLRRIVSHASLMAFAESATSMGNSACAYMFMECNQLTNTLQESLKGAETITHIGNMFRIYQYSRCAALAEAGTEILPPNLTEIGNNFLDSQYRFCQTNLQVAAAEVLPATVTTIGNYFRSNQYATCLVLLAAAPEFLPAGVTSIGNYFRSYQYAYDSALTTLSAEVLQAGLISIGTYFRAYQFTTCWLITIPAAEALPAGLTDIDNYFRANQYQNCNILTVPAAEVLPDSVTTIGNNFRSNQYQNCLAMRVGGHIHRRFASLLNNTNNFYRMFNTGNVFFADTLPRYYLDENTTAPISDLTPTAAKQYLSGRLGIPEYASLHANWK